MTLSDLLFLALVVVLPVLVSVRVFANEPVGRPFLATYMLAVLGSSMLFALSALILSATQVGGVGPFDGFFCLIVSVPVALVVGLLVRRQRRRIAL
ncbi:hypothetical protein [Sphingomonas desiccabilis]|uniref:Uncharacterized protein n=1 Tax=Sphingomonas desiccabilis TaxID=429134 RepID=A0A4Q2IUF0_9SPHN|nr:hypothetical protein [Sphingomonas desiccabilis]MBB3911394.1 hypothetical protein [Sphingomonas desiccabilis]RXZ31829.1 hypothetical protein EO081_11550 [Sphingomonas desiccabilis]